MVVLAKQTQGFAMVWSLQDTSAWGGVEHRVEHVGWKKQQQQQWHQHKFFLELQQKQLQQRKQRIQQEHEQERWCRRTILATTAINCGGSNSAGQSYYHSSRSSLQLRVVLQQPQEHLPKPSFLPNYQSTSGM